MAEREAAAAQLAAHLEAAQRPSQQLEEQRQALQAAQSRVAQLERDVQVCQGWGQGQAATESEPPAIQHFKRAACHGSLGSHCMKKIETKLRTCC